MSGIVSYLAGQSVLITGVKDDPDEPGLLRVYIGPRYNWNYVLVSDPGEQERVRRAWGGLGHITMPKPDGYYTDTERRDASRAAAARQVKENTDALD